MPPVTDQHQPTRERSSRERVQAAAALADGQGIDAVSMRRLSHELGVDAMSLDEPKP